MSRVFIRRADRSTLAPPGCCVVLRSTGQAAAALGVLGLGVISTEQEEITVVAGGLPLPQTFGGGFTRYVAWVFGGGSLRLGITLGRVASNLGGTYAGGLASVVPGPLSEIAVTPEPPFTATLTGPVVLDGSFAFCR